MSESSNNNAGTSSDATTEQTNVQQNEQPAPQSKKEKEVKIFSLEILRFTKKAQYQHGLRHGDYQRYRLYCKKRGRRIRKSLGFLHGKTKFQKKSIEPQTVTDERYLILVLIKAETAWSYAMQLKDDVQNEPRVRYHVQKRLGKASRWAQHLEKLCNARTDPRTILEAEAYSAWMTGSYLLEKEDWQEALHQLSKARTIYDQLGKVGDTEYQELAKLRLEEIEPSIRYCNYNLKGKKGGDNALLEMKMESRGLDLLQSKLDAVIAESLKKQSETFQEVSFQGKRIPLKNEKLRVAILGAQETAFELDRADSYESKISVYDKLFVLYNDALRIITDERTGTGAAAAAGKKKSQKSDTPPETLELLKDYVNYLKLSKTIQRNLLMVESLEQRLLTRTEAAEAPDSSQAANVGDKKRSKPEDLVRIFEIILQNVTELSGLEKDDAESAKQNAANALSYKAYRCYYLALSYLYADKWREALALFDRATEQVSAAKAHHEACKEPLVNEIQKLDRVAESIRGNKCEVHARSFLESVRSKLDEERAQREQQQSGTSKSLLHDLNKFDYSFAQSKQLVPFPPDFEAIKCKPLLFDVAGASLEFPNLEQRKKAKGWGSSWFSWGSKQ